MITAFVLSSRVKFLLDGLRANTQVDAIECSNHTSAHVYRREEDDLIIILYLTTLPFPQHDKKEHSLPIPAEDFLYIDPPAPKELKIDTEEHAAYPWDTNPTSLKAVD
jgi:hypothetical protein